MKRVLITGGKGDFGRALTPRLVQAGYTVRVMSRSPAPAQLAPGMEWAQAEMQTGAGEAEAVAGVDVIVHAASDPLQAQAVDVMGAERLLTHARAAGVEHLLYISIVGIDRIPLAYYQHKLAAEAIIQQSGLPWSIVRVVQFHSFIDRLLAPLRQWRWLPVFPLPTDFQCQPIDVGEVAEHFVEVVKAGPGGRLPDLVGPEVLRLGEMAALWLAAQGLERPLLRLPLWGKVAAGFRNGWNTAPEQRDGTITWAEWVQARYGVAGMVEARLAG